MNRSDSNIKIVTIPKSRQTTATHHILVNIKPINAKKEKLLVEVNKKVYEAKKGIVDVMLKQPVPNNLQKQIDTPPLRVKAFVYNTEADKITHATLQEFQIKNLKEMAFVEKDKTRTTSPLIMSNWEKYKVKKIIDFGISFSLNKTYKTFVPLGINDFNGKYEPYYFAFDYSLRLSDIDELNLTITDENNNLVYSQSYLKPLKIKAKPVPKKIISIPKTKDQNQLIPYNDNPILDKGYTEVGNYLLYWDGFDNDGIYDSTRFNNKKFKAKITAIKGKIKKTKEVLFSTAYSEVDWVDVKINNKTKKIDAIFRVNLKDGGAEGLTCTTYTEDEKTIDGEPNPFYGTKVKICPWDKIPTDVIENDKPIIKERKKSFEEMVKLGLYGINKHWSRVKKNKIAKNITIDGIRFEVIVKAINTDLDSVKEVELVYNTNNFELRSNNPGDVTTFKSAVANTLKHVPYVPLSGQIYYNIGYLNRKYNYETQLLFEKDYWIYININNIKVDKDFCLTVAHEIGHSILKAYSEKSGGSTDYSYKHKGSSDYSNPVSVKEGDFDYPNNGEIDLMKYYNKAPSSFNYDFDRIFASDIDVKSLIWLTKIKILN